MPTHPLPHRADVYAASIRQALVDAELDLPTTEVIAEAAAYCAGWPSLEIAFQSILHGDRRGAMTEVHHCVLAYQTALLEAGDAERIALRHRFLAGEAEKRRRYHEALRDEYAAKAQRLRAQGRTVEAEEAEATAEANRLCAGDARQKVDRLTSRADALTSKAAA